jgi:endo-1,4-beta-mannosidase
MKELGMNCVRVFLTYGSFCEEAGKLKPDGLEKFDRFLELAEQAGIYVHPTGPDHWEGSPKWGATAIDDERNVSALEAFWRLFASRYRGRQVIFAYDLKNEPEVRWDGEGMKEKWNEWLQKKYGSEQALASGWGRTNQARLGDAPIPESKDALNSRELVDYQAFREDLADAWTRRQVEAIKSADPNALVTVGFIQWSVPSVLPGLRHYAAFRPQRQAKFLDFLEVHFYPLARGAFEYKSPEDETANLAYVESVVREVARPGKPVVLAEFGWYGGGKPKFDGGSHPAATDVQQARYCRGVVETTAPFVTGWLNWGFYDQPEATDCSELTGLLTATGDTKAWGTAFAELAARFCQQHPATARIGPRPELNWNDLLTSLKSGAEFRQAYLEAYMKDHKP